MWGHEALAGLDPVLGTLSVPVWAAGAVAAVMVVLLVAAFARAGGLLGTALRTMLVLAGVVGAALLLVERQVRTDRYALEARMAELTTRAVAPGSPLACLDGWGGEAVETACEKRIFASPESLSAAVSYVAARLALLAQAAELRQDASASVDALRLAAESDRFGLVSYVLATRDRCTADSDCAGLQLLRNRERVISNLKQGTFATVLARHSNDWPVAPAVAAAQPPAPTEALEASPPTVPTVASSTSSTAPYFPSASSIPAISIMNAEPTAPAASAPPQAPARAVAEPRRSTPLPPRRPAPQQQGQGPMQLAPATTGAEPRGQ